MLNLCVSTPVIKDWPDCCFFDMCFDCGLTMPADKSMAKDFTVSNYWVVFILIIIGFWNLVSFYRVYKDNDNYVSIMRIGNTMYAFSTAVFGFCRVNYQLGKPLLVWGAIHNASEWVFVAFAFYQNRKIREYAIFGGVCFIGTVIGLVIVILTKFPDFALAEQTTGISLDFMLPFVWFILWSQNRNGKDTKNTKTKSKRKTATKPAGAASTIEPAVYSISDIYFIAFIAHTVHISFTILPLVVVNFIRDQNQLLSRIIEFSIFLSVPITHILYTKFTNLHEQSIDLPSVLNGDENGPKDYPDEYVIETTPFGCCNKDKKAPAFIKMLCWYILCIFIGFIPTIIIPSMLPECDSTKPAPVPDNIFVGFRHTFQRFDGCKDIGRDMIDFNNCQWISGCDTVKAVDKEQGERQLVLKNGQVFNNKVIYNDEENNGHHMNYTSIHYISELDGKVYIELLSDSNSPDQCVGSLKFETNDKIESIDTMYTNFMEQNIAYLQDKYQTAPAVCAKSENGDDGNATCHV